MDFNTSSGFKWHLGGSARPNRYTGDGRAWNAFWTISRAGCRRPKIFGQKSCQFQSMKSMEKACATVDGSEIRRSPVDMVNIPLFVECLYIPGGAGFLPSTVSCAIFKLWTLWSVWVVHCCNIFDWKQEQMFCFMSDLLRIGVKWQKLGLFAARFHREDLL